MARSWLVGGVFRCGGRVLLCRRRADRDFYPDVWDLPGGHVEAGEDDTSALVRECGEELAVHVISSAGVALLEPSPGMSFSVRVVSGWRGNPRNAAPEEHSEIGWFTAAELEALPVADRRYVPLLTGLLHPSARLEIRREDSDVWASVGALHALSQQETYTALLPVCDRPRFRPADLAEKWRARAVRESGLVLHGGWSDDQLIGFAVTTRLTPAIFELNSLHVRPDWRGRGLADWLHRAAVAHVNGQGGLELRLWVLEQNLRARRFYDKHGWRRTEDSRIVTVGGTPLPAIAYAYSLRCRGD
ncbi:MAG TPA: GNAT family N-acetyltransferase [Candidatus Limnocylindrales bacterium]